MTWVIGIEGLPRGLLIADTRVTMRDPTGRRPDFEFDGVQKVHAVHANMAVGFAGNVDTGLKVVSDLIVMSRNSIPPDCLTHEPSRLLFAWARRVRYHWANTLTSRETTGGCELLFVAALAPGAFGRSRTIAYTLRAPTFTPIRASWLEPVAIGSGTNVPEYVDEVRKLADEKNALLGMSNSEWDPAGGPLIVLSAVLADRIRRVAAPGISPHLVLCSVRWGSVELGTNEGVGFDPEHRAERWPKIAHNIPEWQALKKAHGHAGLVAVTSPVAAAEEQAA